MPAHKDKRVAKKASMAASFGFLAGLFAPAWLFEIDAGVNLFLAVLVFVGSPFAGMALASGLEWLGIRLFGRRVVTWVNITVFVVLLAVLGGWAGYHFSGGDVIVAGFAGLCLALPNAFLFFSRRAYLLGEADTSEEEMPTDPIEATRRAPLWQRFVAIVSCVILVFVGLIFIVRQEVATKSGIVVRGTGAIVVGVCVMLFGAAFFGLALYYEFRAQSKDIASDANGDD